MCRVNEQFRRGIIVGVCTYVVWGLLTAYWKLLHRFRAFELIGWRIACAALVMVVVVSVSGGWRAIRPPLADPAVRRRVALASVALTVNWTSYVWAVVHDHVLETAALVTPSPRWGRWRSASSSSTKSGSAGPR